MKKLIGLILILSYSEISTKEISFNNWIEQEIESFNGEERILTKNSGTWTLDKVRLRVRPLLGIEVPYLASLEIKPFIEFHWKNSKPK
jgi:hypothetical protein